MYQFGPKKKKKNRIHVIQKLCLRNTISVLYISLDIRYPNLKVVDIYKAKI